MINAHSHPFQTYINSIDEAEIMLNSELEGDEFNLKDFGITSEQEFWGHCSNLQAWVENNYDTRLLHRSFAFPLLLRLSQINDTKAILVFRDEIINRIEEGNPQVLTYLAIEGYFNYLPKDYIEQFSIPLKSKLIKIMFNTLDKSDTNLIFGSLFLFDVLFSILRNEDIDKFISLIKEKNLRRKILFNPELIPKKGIYFYGDMLTRLRKCILHDILESKNLRGLKDFYPPKTDNQYLEFYKNYLEKLEAGKKIRFS